MRSPASGFLVLLGFLSVLAVALGGLAGGNVALGVAGGIAVAWGLWLVRRAPLTALKAGFFIILVAETEFRARDPLAAAGGSVDFEVMVELGLYALLALITSVWFLRLRGRLGLTTLEKIAGAYVLVALASTAWSPIPTFTLVRASQLAVLLAYAVVVARVLGRVPTWRVAMFGLLAYVVIGSLIGPPASALGISSPMGTRFTWLEVHAIQAGTFLGLTALALLASLLFEPRAPRRGLRIALFLVAVALHVLTLARGPLGAFLVASFSLVLLRTVRRSVATLVITVSTAFVLVVMNVPGGFVGVVEGVLGSGVPWVETISRGQDASQLLSLTGRIALWQALFPGFLDHPFVGHGYQVARIVGVEIAPWAGEAHNALLQSLIELGGLGTLLLLVSGGGAMISSYREASGRVGEVALAASLFAAVLFEFVNAVGTAGFAGSPGFEPLLLFTVIVLSTGPPTRDGA